jgi:hypothetical protein
MTGVDIDALAVRRISELRSYLESRGWKPDDDPGRRRWTRPVDDDQFEIVLPTEGSRDYTRRIADVLHTLTIAEERSPELILRDLAATVFDVTRLRTGIGRGTDTATLADAVRTFQSAQSLVRAAATVVDERNRETLGSRTGNATHLLRRVRAGQTSPGSYVVTVLVPVEPAAFDLDHPTLGDVPFARQVTLGLERSVRSARDAAEFAARTGGDLRGFRLGAAEGVNARICKALASLAGDDRAPFELGFSWSAGLSGPTVEPVGFGVDLVERLTEGARELDRPGVSTEVTLRGRIEQLAREAGQPSGKVVVRGEFVSDPMRRQRQTTIRLTADDYDRAIAAHRDELAVELHGPLALRRGHWTLDAESFTVLGTGT